MILGNAIVYLLKGTIIRLYSSAPRSAPKRGKLLELGLNSILG